MSPAPMVRQRSPGRNMSKRKVLSWARPSRYSARSAGRASNRSVRDEPPAHAGLRLFARRVHPRDDEDVGSAQASPSSRHKAAVRL